MRNKPQKHARPLKLAAMRLGFGVVQPQKAEFIAGARAALIISAILLMLAAVAISAAGRGQGEPGIKN